jgi:hypothetical protein
MADGFILGSDDAAILCKVEVKSGKDRQFDRTKALVSFPFCNKKAMAPTTCKYRIVTLKPET